MAEVWDFGISSIQPASKRLVGEHHEREALVSKAISFNVPYLDDFCGGIMPHDLVLLGARSGIGKTALASLIAHQNAIAGKRVYFFALEAEPREIERRIKYRRIASTAFDEHTAPGMTYRDWYMGKFDKELGDITARVNFRIERELKTLHTYYRGSTFGIADIVKLFTAVQHKADLIILDHLHYIDTNQGEENAAYKEIVKCLRDLSISMGVPILVVCHVRKADRNAKQSLPMLDDFHGSSDITKVATKVVVIGPGTHLVDNTGFAGTYMQVVKDRVSGYCPYVAACLYDRHRNDYRNDYVLGRLKGNELIETQAHQLPGWAENAIKVRQ